MDKYWDLSSMLSGLDQGWLWWAATIFTTSQINPALWLSSWLELVLTSWPMGSLRACIEVGQSKEKLRIIFRILDEILKSEHSLWLSPSSSMLMFATFNYTLVHKHHISKFSNKLNKTRKQDLTVFNFPLVRVWGRVGNLSPYPTSWYGTILTLCRSSVDSLVPVSKEFMGIYILYT